MKTNLDTKQKLSDVPDINKRFIEVMKYKGYSGYKLAQEIEGLSEAKIAHIRSGRNKVSSEILKLITNKFPDINPIWLLTGHEAMIKGEKAPEKKITATEPILADEAINYNQQGIPYYNVDFTNGFLGIVEIQNIKPDYFINYPPANNCDFWINATGHSMESVINHGDIVAVKQVDVNWFPLGEIYAIVTSNGYRLIKRITKSTDPQCYRLISENKDKEKYPDQDIPKHYITHLFKVIIATKILN
jgi:putative phage repressor